jgi:hypothetical protein
VQHLPGVGTDGEDRVITADFRVAERRALLGAAERLADERVDVNDQALVVRSAARRPRALDRRSNTRSSWRTCPNVNERKNVPSVDGAIIRCPTMSAVRPDRSRSQSSMQSAPSAIADSNVMTLAPS